MKYINQKPDDIRIKLRLILRTSRTALYKSIPDFQRVKKLNAIQQIEQENQSILFEYHHVKKQIKKVENLLKMNDEGLMVFAPMLLKKSFINTTLEKL